jgi:transposase
MRKFNGIPRESFELFLKECEWRFNTPTAKDQLDLFNLIRDLFPAAYGV